MSKRLSIAEQELLNRHHDGELSGPEVQAVEELLEGSGAARVFLAALGELRLAARLVEEDVWAMASVPTAAIIAELAATMSVADESLEDIAPLLERFHDGEADEVERAFVVALIEERGDVADYLATLGALSTDFKDLGSTLGAGADFGGFWDKLEARLDEVAFDAEEHTVLLYRYHDGEVSAEESAQVEGWVKDGHPEVKETLAALAELHIGVNAGIEIAQEKVDLHSMWANIEDRLDEQDLPESAPSQEAPKVISLGEERLKRQKVVRTVFAIAAAVTLMFMGAMFGQRVMDSGPVIIERTVVIVDSVEYAPGSSVMINGPIESVSMGSDEDEAPTIIWLLDDEDEQGGQNGLYDQPI